MSGVNHRSVVLALEHVSLYFESVRRKTASCRSIIAVATLMLCSLVSAADLPDDVGGLEAWNRLLHLENGRTLVEPDGFYLSDVMARRLDPVAEIAASLERLESPRAEEFACSFPLRYEWLVVNGLTNVILQTEDCPELRTFIAGFQRETVSLAFISDSLSSPAAAFGHVTLILRDRRAPSALADTVHYGAIVEKTSALDYVRKGLGGGFDGVFLRDPLFKTLDHYVSDQQRLVHEYRLDLEPAGIERLILHLHELRRATFRYYFVRENCAYQLASLLSVAYDKPIALPSHVTLPSRVVHELSPHIVSYHLLGPESVADGRRAEPRLGRAVGKTSSIDLRSPSDLGPDLHATLRRSGSPRLGAVEIGWTESKHGQQQTLGLAWLTRDRLPSGDRNTLGQRLSVLDATLSMRKDGARLETLSLLRVRARSIERRSMSWDADIGANRMNRLSDLRSSVSLVPGVAASAGVLKAFTGLGASVDIGRAGVSVHLLSRTALGMTIGRDSRLRGELLFKSDGDVLSSHLLALERSFGAIDLRLSWSGGSGADLFEGVGVEIALGF